jgi:DnaK suppressor protein
MHDERLQTIRVELVRQKELVERQLADHGAGVTDDEVNVSVNEGFADSAQATAERSQLMAMIGGLRSHHSDIVKALNRLDDGSYGRCERCGREIPIERLEARPTAGLCVSCKEATGQR